MPIPYYGMLQKCMLYARSVLIGIQVASGIAAIHGYAWADPPASKADIAAAKRLFSQAEQEEAKERWAAALDKLQRIVAIKETAGIRFHMAVCEERLGQLVAAQSDYRKSEELGESLTNAQGKEISERAVTHIAELAQRIPTVTLVIPNNIPQLTVTIDGNPLTDWSHPLPLDTGDHQVEASAPGHVRFAKTLLLTEHNTITVPIVLPFQESTRALPITQQASSSAETPSAIKTPAIPPHAWAAGGASLALAGTAVGFYLTGNSASQQRDTICTTYRVCDRQKRDSVVTRDYTLAAVAGGAAMVAAGFTTWFALTSHPEAAKPSRVSWGVSPGGMTVSGRFW